MIDLQEYLRMRERPEGMPVMQQKWRDLTFLHYSVDPSEIQLLLPAGLTVDTFPNEAGQERAWVGMSPFHMCDVHVTGLPPLPFHDAFPETNVRTYVHFEGREPGVWFFSLDVARTAVVLAARAVYGLPYYRSMMKVIREDRIVSYRSHRGEGSDNTEDPGTVNLDVRTGDDLPPAEPGTLDFFLIERYVLYGHMGKGLIQGQVHHCPYPLSQAQVLQDSQSLLRSDGLPAKPWEHVVFSPGVDVDVFAPHPPS